MGFLPNRVIEMRLGYFSVNVLQIVFNVVDYSANVSMRHRSMWHDCHAPSARIASLVESGIAYRTVRDRCELAGIRNFV